MSTIKADTLSNLAGTQTVPVSTVAQGSAKAWVNFNGTGTVAIRASFNVSSITDNGTGSYTVNFSAAMQDADYSWSGLAGSPGIANGVQLLGTPSASSVPIFTVNTGFSPSDFNTVTVSVFR
jgi:hypothetical protein